MREEGRFGRGMGRMRRGNFAPGEEGAEETVAGEGRPWMQRPLLRRFLMKKLMQRQDGLGEGHSGPMGSENDIKRLEQLVERLETRVDEVLRELKDLKQSIKEASRLQSSPKAEGAGAEGEGT